MGGESFGKSMKSKPGLTRLLRALQYSWYGLRAAAQHEAAFRQELMLVVPLSIVAWFVPVPLLERALLFAVLQVILIVELINSAIEANTDHITMDEHPLAQRAKDMGSAAVLLSLVISAAIWTAVLWPVVARWIG
ncbi:MAG: diacylglycerol kinase [Planctomycetota bacterium]